MTYDARYYGAPSDSYRPPAGTVSPPGGGPVDLLSLLPGIGQAVGGILGSSKSAVQRAAEYEAELKAAIARGAPIGVVEQWRNKLAAARYEVDQQKAWDTQQQQVLFGVQALQATGVLVGAALVLLLLSKAVRR
jgi:hypothetical protein